MPVVFLSEPPSSVARRALSEADAIDIWIQRWLRIRSKDIVARYGCDPRRIYEIWEEKRFAGSRDKALAVFRNRYPQLEAQTDFSLHRRLSLRTPDPTQLVLFE